MKLHQTVCQHRFVVEMAGADIVGMRHVLSRQHVDDAGRGFDVRQVHGDDLRMSAVGHAQRRVQRPRRFRDVVDIISGARHMLVGAVMAQGRMHGSGNGLAFLEGGIVHQQGPSHLSLPPSGEKVARRAG